MTTFAIGTVKTHLGLAVAYREAYALGGLAIRLLDSETSELIATLSVWVEETPSLPANHFYAKEWSENARIAAECLASGLFALAPEFPVVSTGFVTTRVWRIIAP